MYSAQNCNDNFFLHHTSHMTNNWQKRWRRQHEVVGGRLRSMFLMTKLIYVWLQLRFLFNGNCKTVFFQHEQHIAKVLHTFLMETQLVILIWVWLPSRRARPKSMSLILLPVLLTHMMFSGLRSRWTIPCLWMKLTPSMICSMYLITSLSVSSKSSSMIRSNSSPPEILQTEVTTQTDSLLHLVTSHPKWFLYLRFCNRPAQISTKMKV